MKFGAHEVMETHEMLSSMINEINHHNLYAKEASNPVLKEMVVRHQQHTVAAYNEIVQYTQGGGNGSFRMIQQQEPLTMQTASMMPNAQIQYGLRQPAPHSPESNTSFSDWEIASAMLICHKNGARNAMTAALECADPNLRMMMLNCANACANHAYETFLFMNQQGMYQVPTLQEHTAQTYLNTYQPASPNMLNMANPNSNPTPGQSPNPTPGVSFPQ